MALAAAPDIDVVVELIGGSGGVARRLVQTALRSGKHVVTANKALLAMHGAELAALAEKRGRILAFEAAVAGGIPIIKALREGLVGNRVRRLYGILNGTCNYILTTMRETGRDFDDVLAEAQAAGYAEADPQLRRRRHRRRPQARRADRRGVRRHGSISPASMSRASATSPRWTSSSPRSSAIRIKLLGLARETRYGIEQRVHPCMVPLAAPIAHIEGVFNAVVVEGDFVGTTMFQGRGAGQGPTASAVVADLVDVARGRHMPAFVVPAARLADKKASPMDRHVGAYYMRLMVQDRPGVIAAVSGALAEERISLEIDAAARALAVGRGAGRADHARDGRGGDAARAGADRQVEGGGRGALPDPDRDVLDGASRRRRRKRWLTREEHRQDGPQPGAGGGARDRSGGARGLQADGPRRREDGRPGRRRRHAHGAQLAGHRRHRGDRRGRARRGADALYRREGRRAAAPRSTSRSIRWRAPPSPPRACPMRSPSWRWPSMAASSMRPTSTWTRSRSAAACPTASSISTRRPSRTSPTSPRPRRSTSPTSWSASSTGRAMPS